VTGRPRRFPEVAEVLLWASAIFCPFALATVPTWATLVALALALAAFSAATVAALRRQRPMQMPFLGKIFGIALGVIALQLVPLPPFLLRLLSPAADDLFKFSLGPLGGYPAWRPLSLDPSATAVDLGRFATTFLVYLAAAQVASARVARRRLAMAVSGAGLAIALCGYGHALVRAQSLFGFHHFLLAAPPLLTPFGNPNHLASLLALGALMTLGLMVRADDPPRRLLLLLIYAAQAAAVFLSLSRGGIVAFLAGHLVFIGLYSASRRTEKASGAVPRRVFLLPAAAGVGVAVAAFLGWETIWARLSSIDSVEKLQETKLSLIPSFVPLIREYWLTGIGRGAFESGYHRYQTLAPIYTFSYPENWVLEQICELGILAGSGFVIACIWAWGRAALDSSRSVVVFGALAASFSVGLHELVDFGTEFGGLAVPLAIVLGIATHGTRRVAELPKFWVSRALAGAVAVAGFPLILWGSGHSLAADGAALAALRDDPAAVEKKAAEIAALHPADYYTQLVPALSLEAPGVASPVRTFPWVNRAMYLNPSAPWPHRLAARCLRQFGRPAQARLEYRLAFPASDKANIADEIVDVFSEPTDLLDAVPDDVESVAWVLQSLANKGKYQVREKTGLLFVAARGDSDVILAMVANSARALRRPADALRFTERALSVNARSVPAAMERAYAFEDLGRRDDAVQAFETALLLQPTNSGLLLAASAYCLGVGRAARALELSEQLLHVAPDFTWRARALAAEGGAYLAEGKVNRAVESYRAAIQAAPELEELRWSQVQALEQAGRLRDALAAVNGLAAVASSASSAQIETVRQRISNRLEEQDRARELAGASTQ
jgi:Tfp pilus assembly protein PilF